MAADRLIAFRRKRPEELETMTRAGRILAECLDHVASQVAPGVTTQQLDTVAETFIRDHGCVPSFLGYNGFPKSICISVNEECVHGMPGARVITEGDLVCLDCGVILEGWQADAGMTVACGAVDEESRRLLDVTYGALQRGIAAAQPGNRIGDIGAAISAYVVAAGFSLLHDHCGHGIGRRMHEPPEVPNYGTPGRGNELKPGLVLAIEPIVNAGTGDYRILGDGWTVVTADGRRSAYWEHTVAITEDGPRVLTLRGAERTAALV
ncbi:MAG TPA: type I methionyl aminopeptidase [Candidatus Dormibacteraeota bacterium]|jgi:methionyl aminopeptidase|nr:type I methionyl aminopeptidase [Candidatus Dormibacteraeota bacterium]